MNKKQPPSHPTDVAQAAAQAAAQPAQQQDQHVAYPMSFLNAMAGYLADRPFKEVAGLIQGLERLGVAVELPKSDAPQAK